MRLLWAVEHGLGSVSRRMEQSIGVTELQRLVVRLVGQRPGISAGDLAATLHLHPSTLTEVFWRLLDKGIIERMLDPKDARRSLFRLKKRGRELDAVRHGTGEALVGIALGSTPEKDFAAAVRVLDRVARALGERPALPPAVATGKRRRRPAAR